MKIIVPFFMLADDHFYPVSVQQQQPGDILHTFPGSTLMECLLRCSRMNESNSIERTITGQSPRGYCHLYRAPFAKTLKYQNQHQDKQYYNKNKLVLKELYQFLSLKS